MNDLLATASAQKAFARDVVLENNRTNYERNKVIRGCQRVAAVCLGCRAKHQIEHVFTGWRFTSFSKVPARYCDAGVKQGARAKHELQDFVSCRTLAMHTCMAGVLHSEA